ncbi:hypothetical protein Ahy_A03g015862 isoform B [Arachis hypogaea]|uniref:MICOS complex subunit n=1 Tax=Arachis hypogaea TaxID=3818 RepID=A0A445E1H0_ARAHY|nr:hypothetical protein Ahy_A03g015862 isoform B [Arachis hypogaea]
MGKGEELDAKWEACLDLSLRRVVYSSLAGAFGGLLFFRSPTTRWASVAFGAGVGIGSAYTECSSLFAGSATKIAPPQVHDTPIQVTFFSYLLLHRNCLVSVSEIMGCYCYMLALNTSQTIGVCCCFTKK